MTSNHAALQERHARTLCLYLDPWIATRHRAEVRAELFDLLPELSVDARMTEAIILTADAEVIAAWTRLHGPASLIRKPARYQDSAQSPWNSLRGESLPQAAQSETEEVLRAASHTVWQVLRFENMPQASRIGVFEALRNALPPRQEDFGALASQALRLGDPELYRHLEARLNPSDAQIDAMLCDKTMLIDASPEVAEILVEILTSRDLTAEPWPQAVENILRQQVARPFAVFLKLGVDIAAARQRWEEGAEYGGSWRARFIRLTESNHGMMAILTKLPAPAEILRMPEKEVQRLIAGPSRKDLKAEKALARQRDAEAHQEAIRQKRAERRARERAEAEAQGINQATGSNTGSNSMPH